VEEVDGDGASTASNQASATTASASSPTTPDFTLGVSVTSLTVNAGSSGTETVTLTPQNGFTPTATVALTCSGLPSDAACSFSPATVTSTGNMISTITVKTTAASSTGSYKSGPLFPGSVLAVALYFFGRKRRRGLQLLLLAISVASLSLLTGCGVPLPAPQQVTSMITVNASSGSLQHTTTFSLIVQTPVFSPGSPEAHNNVSPLFPGAVLAVALCFFGRKRRHRVQLMVALCAFGMVLLSGCGGATTIASPTGGSQTVPPPPTIPSITTQPLSQTVSAGQTATFSVVAGGTSPLTYQWESNGAPIAGANASSYTTPPTTAQNNGIAYTVVVSNAAGPVTSSAAVLTVTSSSSCSVVPSVPGSVTSTTTSTSQINLSWSASSAPSTCTVNYNVYRSTTPGFTPASNNQVANSIAGTTFGDSGLAASTSYFIS